MMGDVINLDEYRKKKEETHVDILSQRVNDIIADLDLDLTPKPYYPEKRINIGLCIDSLLFASDSLIDMGYKNIADDIDDLIVKLSIEQSNI